MVESKEFWVVDKSRVMTPSGIYNDEIVYNCETYPGMIIDITYYDNRINNVTQIRETGKPGIFTSLIDLKGDLTSLIHENPNAITIDYMPKGDVITEEVIEGFKLFPEFKKKLTEFLKELMLESKEGRYDYDAIPSKDTTGRK